jgi:hypothetical protein
MTMSTKSTFQQMKDELKAMADEIKLQVHLGSLEAKEKWAELEPKIQAASTATGDAITEGVDDLKAEVAKLRDKLKKDEPKPT